MARKHFIEVRRVLSSVHALCIATFVRGRA